MVKRFFVFLIIWSSFFLITWSRTRLTQPSMNMIIRWKKVVIYLWLSPIWIFVWCKRCSFSVQTRKGVTPADQKVTQVLRQDCRPCIRKNFGKCFHITNCNFCFNFLNGFQKKKGRAKNYSPFFCSDFGTELCRKVLGCWYKFVLWADHEILFHLIYSHPHHRQRLPLHTRKIDPTFFF